MDAAANGPVAVQSDPLTEVLQYLHIEGTFYCRSELTAPWSLGLHPMPDCLWFHVITSGSCVLIDHTGTEHHVRRGDLVVLPHGAGHTIACDPSIEPSPVLELTHDYVSPTYAVIRHGGGGERVDLVCGAVRLAHPSSYELVEMLPPVMHIDASSSGDSLVWLPSLLGIMASEAREPRPGSEAVVTRICDILVVSAIRAWLETDPEAMTGWLGALRDPQIGSAVALIHREPERDWTVEDLAATVAMSRSAFSARFSELVGEGPMRYVTRWRMHVATQILTTERPTVAVVAERLGYSSEAAFSRAYKRMTGKAAGDVRRSRLR